MPTALITGITGQDGSYLAELLLEKKYHVIGLLRRSARTHLENIKQIANEVQLVYGDVQDSGLLMNTLQQYRPDEIYNLAAQSSPADSWKQPIYTAEITGIGPVRLFEAARQVLPQAKIYQASTSEMFGDAVEVPQTEDTIFNANNPYGAAKLYAHMMARMYRQGYNQFISCGILFNHESPRRGENFITRKVARAVACLKLNVKDVPLNENGEPLVTREGKFKIGNLDGKRDWGYAKEYVEAMWLMLQQEQPDEFIVATGEVHTVRELCEAAFSHVGLNWEDHVETDPQFVRPLETGPLVGNPEKIKRVLKWSPQTTFKELIGLMVDHELAAFK